MNIYIGNAVDDYRQFLKIKTLPIIDDSLSILGKKHAKKP